MKNKGHLIQTKIKKVSKLNELSTPPNLTPTADSKQKMYSKKTNLIIIIKQ